MQRERAETMPAGHSYRAKVVLVSAQTSTSPDMTMSCYPYLACLRLCMSTLRKDSPTRKPPSLSSREHLQPSLA